MLKEISSLNNELVKIYDMMKRLIDESIELNWKPAKELWNIKIDQTLKLMGFKQSEQEPCLYLKRANGETTALALFVDDIIVSSSSTQEMHKLI